MGRRDSPRDCIRVDLWSGLRRPSRRWPYASSGSTLGNIYKNDLI